MCSIEIGLVEPNGETISRNPEVVETKEFPVLRMLTVAVESERDVPY